MADLTDAANDLNAYSDRAAFHAVLADKTQPVRVLPCPPITQDPDFGCGVVDLVISTGWVEESRTCVVNGPWAAGVFNFTAGKDIEIEVRPGVKISIKMQVGGSFTLCLWEKCCTIHEFRSNYCVYPSCVTEWIGNEQRDRNSCLYFWRTTNPGADCVNVPTPYDIPSSNPK